MTSLKTLALAATAIAGLGLFAMNDAEARGFGGRGGGGIRAGGFHGGGLRHGGMHFGGRHFAGHRHGHWRGGRWIGLGVVGVGATVIASDCYRYRWVDTPYGLVRRTVNICAD
ncbi:MAG: hypothetical protein ACRCVA_20045 [Phreatobacter sp.]